MKPLQEAAYAGKMLGGGPIGRIATFAAKYAAGCYFDLFCKQYRTEGLTFNIPRDHSTKVMRGRFAADTYELPERTLVRKYMPRRSTVLELGGSIGVVSCSANRLLQDPRAHVVVEANPFLISTLEENRALNGAAFSIEHCVVSSTAEEASFKVSANLDSSRLDADGLPIPARSLASIEATYNLMFDAIIMDIEGAESEFIRSHIDILPHIRFAVIEFHPAIIGQTEVDALRRLLLQSGLQQLDQMLTVEAFSRA